MPNVECDLLNTLQTQCKNSVHFGCEKTKGLIRKNKNTNGKIIIILGVLSWHKEKKSKRKRKLKKNKTKKP